MEINRKWHCKREHGSRKQAKGRAVVAQHGAWGRERLPSQAMRTRADEQEPQNLFIVPPSAAAFLLQKRKGMPAAGLAGGYTTSL